MTLINEHPLDDSIKRGPSTPSLPTPLLSHSETYRRIGAPLKSPTLASSASNSFNRAEFIITRLENWCLFLKSLIGWVEETSKIALASSRNHSQRAYAHLDSSFSFQTTLLNGLQTMVMHIAAQQQEFGKRLERHHIPELIKLRKKAKEKIHKLKNDHSLSMDELLRRAEVTRSKMTHLNRCCKQAEKTKGQVEMDPWLANSLVLCQLKREVDEENRLRLLMIPIQKDAEMFEKRLLEIVKPIIEYCYKILTPTNPEPPLILTPEQEWSQFVDSRKNDFVDEEHPTKDFLKINYPNKFHPLVMTLLKGKLERRIGVRKQFVEKYYFLSQGGYLHQYNLDNKRMPEKTIYIPNTTIVPSIDLNEISSNDVILEHAVPSHLQQNTVDSHYTFEICRPATNVLQRDKISVFRTSTKADLITWCRMLVQIASGGIHPFPTLDNEHYSTYSNSTDLYVSHNSTFTIEEEASHLSSSISQPPSSASAESKDLALAVAKAKSVTIKPATTIAPSSSPVHSLRSVKTEESFNEPAAMNTSTNHNNAVSTENADFTHDTIAGYEDANADAESFVTAQSNKVSDAFEDTYYGSDEDTQSIASILTEKGPSASNVKDDNMSPQHPVTTMVDKSPSLAPSAFDDAQSSLYFSSASALPSPNQSNRSSIVSIPEFKLVPEKTTVVNNTRASAAEVYKASLSMNLEEEE
ncbi:MAG: hypothetical protein EXX96DRAFT_481792 [Benjaminiella poitrasii]|nr:MAG: hypothetical protein EXX96DRAFT_481792 [Benjaminiella poitrasii]